MPARVSRPFPHSTLSRRITEHAGSLVGEGGGREPTFLRTAPGARHVVCKAGHRASTTHDFGRSLMMATVTRNLPEKSIKWLQDLIQVNLDSRDRFKEAADNLKAKDPT